VDYPSRERRREKTRSSRSVADIESGVIRISKRTQANPTPMGFN
jgi:hypothetical protein